MKKSVNNMLNFKVLIIGILLMFVSSNSYSQTLRVDLTYYHATHNSLTADGSKINNNHVRKEHIKWCAVSRDIWNMFPANSTNRRIYIEGFGIYHVKDKMHKKWKRKVDILIHKSKLDKVENKHNIAIHLIYTLPPKKNGNKRNNQRTSHKRYSQFTQLQHFS